MSLDGTRGQSTIVLGSCFSIVSLFMSMEIGGTLWTRGIVPETTVNAKWKLHTTNRRVKSLSVVQLLGTQQPQWW